MDFFYLLLLLSLGFSSFFVISSRNPIHSVLSLISVFILSAILLLCLEVEFLALSFIIVYVGAIAILFLFVVMMLDIKIGDNSLNFLSYGPLGFLLSFIFILEITFYVADFSPIFQLSVPLSTNYFWINWISEIDSLANVQAIGQLLYTYYFVLFLMAGFILFIAVIGSLMLTLRLQKN
jgi:NADH-quinone oxidoreductase subunit J